MIHYLCPVTLVSVSRVENNDSKEVDLPKTWNKIIKPKVIIWCNVQSGVVFSTHIDPNSGATGGGHKIHMGKWA